MSVLTASKPGVSGRDRCNQRLDPDNVHDPCQIIGQNRETHLGGLLLKRFGQKVRRSHVGLHRAERMFDGLSTLAHGVWISHRGAIARLRADAHAPIV